MKRRRRRWEPGGQTREEETQSHGIFRANQKSEIGRGMRNKWTQRTIENRKNKNEVGNMSK
jgi:hypothetical protein